MTICYMVYAVNSVALIFAIADRDTCNTLLLAPDSWSRLLSFSLQPLPSPVCSHLWVVCIINILPTTRNTAPDTAFPDSNTFGTYDNAEDNVPYIASEFDMTRVNLPYTFGVGDESEPNDFPNQYTNGPVMSGSTLDCFVRYFVSTEVRGEQAPHAHSSPAVLTPCMCLLPPAGHANEEEEEGCHF